MTDDYCGTIAGARATATWDNPSATNAAPTYVSDAHSATRC